MKKIKELRLSKGLTLKQVADRLGVSEGTVQRYESGAISNLKYDTMVALANIFGVSPQYLMGWEEESLTNLETQLIETVSDLNTEGQQKVLEYARLLMASGEYKKRDSLVVGE